MNLFIALPCFGGMIHSTFFQCVLELVKVLDKNNIDHEIICLANESLISRARNSFVAMFLEKVEYTHLLFLDVDIMFDPLDILKLTTIDKDICGLSYPKKALNWNKIRHILKEHPTISDNDLAVRSTDMNLNLKVDSDKKCLVENEFVEVNDIPTGCMLIKRSSLITMIHKYEHRKYTNNVHGYSNRNTFYDLFCVGVENDIYLSEDYYFCKLARDAGLRLWLSCTAILGHVGRYEYLGSAGLVLSENSNERFNMDLSLKK
jgi:hypothetical protein